MGSAGTAAVWWPIVFAAVIAGAVRWLWWESKLAPVAAVTMTGSAIARLTGCDVNRSRIDDRSRNDLIKGERFIAFGVPPFEFFLSFYRRRR